MGCCEVLWGVVGCCASSIPRSLQAQECAGSFLGVPHAAWEPDGWVMGNPIFCSPPALRPQGTGSLQPSCSPPQRSHLPQSPQARGRGAAAGGCHALNAATGLRVISSRFKRSDEEPVTGGRVAIKSCHV